jgi:hypothetical protein
MKLTHPIDMNEVTENIAIDIIKSTGYIYYLYILPQNELG